ncbi:S-methyl-5-thioribose-1-phosphate isomerase [bacterium]|nr:S-methyl-5-thioribose-1-phosphate isomerase [bacterium]
MFHTILWKNNTAEMIDQRKLPRMEEYFTAKNHQEMIYAIKEMVIRGAPAIGVAGAMGVALAALEIKANNFDSFLSQLKPLAHNISNARPTAVNLSWAVTKMLAFIDANKTDDIKTLTQKIIDESIRIGNEDVAINKKMGSNGATLIQNGDTILTHCNAGALATAGFGTALGVIYAAQEQGKKIKVFADETRPFLQGARLTAWELTKNGVDTTLISDNMAGHLMKKGLIHKVIVGADRIAANGDTANKIGTYTVAVLANRHKIPFFVAAPLSTIDIRTQNGEEIEIEERTPLEVTHIQGVPIAPEGIKVMNPAFDVTPSELITAIITEAGIIEKPFTDNIKRLFGK